MADSAQEFYAQLDTDPEAALRDVIARRELHRATEHGETNPHEFIDCAACGVLDAQLGRAQHANDKAVTVGDAERVKNWRRAPEGERCESTVRWPSFTGIGTTRCDHSLGHKGRHEYLTVAGIIVQWENSRG